MTTPTNLADCSALTLLALYRSGDVSPVEATSAVLDRIARLNPVLNAFCHLAPEEALASARASEARWMRKAPCGELDGVPVSVKDLILAAGWPTLRGSRTVDRAGPWDVDAPATARFCSARRRLPSSAARARPTRRSPASRAIPGTRRRLRADRRAAPRPRSQREWGRSRSAPTAPAACASRPRSAATSV
jgi:hypothetical protein